MDTARGKEAEALIMRAYRTLGIQSGRVDVQSALDDPQHGPAFAQWALTHLGRDTLLTANELELYMALDKSGRVDQLADLHDLAEVQSVTEDELRMAIEELGKSTETVSKQTETLRQQHDAMSRLATKQRENATRREELHQVRRRQSELERAQLAKEIGQISRDITFRLADLEQHGTALNDGITAVLQSDDKLLSSLQKLGWELDQPDPDEAQALERLQEACMRLIKATVETVRTRLDTTYLETLVTIERSGTAEPATNDEVKDLQEEVESLYSEILSVAQMSVNQQHLEPALKAIAAQSGQSMVKTDTSLHYVNECLVFLLDRMTRLHAHVKSHKSYEGASAAMTATAKAELAVEIAPTKQSRPVAFASPARGSSPTRTPRNTRSRRRSSPNASESPIETLLQNLAVSLPLHDTKLRDQVALLRKVLVERTNKCNEVAKGAQESFEITARAQLDDMRQAMQLARDSLLAESPFAEVKLIDPDIESSILVLAQEVDKAQQKMRLLEGQSLVAKSEKREDLIRRWGS